MTTITEPGEKHFQLIMLKSHLKLHLKGMRHSRVTLKKFLEAATLYTGKKYTRNTVQQAVDDLQAMINEEFQKDV